MITPQLNGTDRLTQSEFYPFIRRVLTQADGAEVQVAEIARRVSELLRRDFVNRYERDACRIACAKLAGLAGSPVVRVGHGRSGVYRYVHDTEDLEALKRAQAQRRSKIGGRKSGHFSPPRPKPASVTHDLTHLDVLESRSGVIVARGDDGRVYRVLLEPVIS